MNRKNKKLLRQSAAATLAGILLVCGTTVQAQIISFSNTALGGGNSSAAATVSATTLGTGMSVGVVSRGSGIANGAGTSRFNSTGFNVANAAAAISGNKYFRITLAPTANYTYSLTSIGGTFGSSGTGPTSWGVYAGLPGFTAATQLSTGSWTAGGTTSVTPGLGSGLTGLTSATEIRVYAWGASASGGTFGPGNGAALNVNGTATLRSAGTLTWDGGQGNGNWNSYTGTAVNQSNWNLNNLPASTIVDTLAFAGNTQTTTSNNIVGLTVGAITFNSGAGAFTNSGNSLTLNGAITNNSANLQTISHAMALSSGTHSFHAAAGNLAVSGDISGGGGVGKSGANLLTLSGNNSYTGGTAIQDGAVLASHAKALGTGNVTVSGDAQLQVGNSIALNIGAGNAITLTSEEAVYRKNFANGEIFTNANSLQSDLTVGGVDTSAAILAGAAGTGGLFAEMSFSAAEAETLSNILSLEGIDGQVFALSLTVGAGLLDNDSALGWFDSVDGWELAVAENSGVGAEVLPIYLGYQGTFAEFQAIVINEGSGVLGDYLGAYGVDAATGETWAILDHNSDFAVINAVPEPSTSLLLAGVAIGFFVFRRRFRTA